MQRSDVIRYFVMEYFDGSLERASEATGYSTDQFRSWVDGHTQLLNPRPRMAFDFRTPEEAMAEELQAFSKSAALDS